MADASILPRPVWDNATFVGRHGRRSGAAGVTIAEVPAISIATVIVRLGQEPALAAKLMAEFGVELPSPRRSTASSGVTLLSTGPGRFLALSRVTAPSLASDLASRLAGLATCTDQSHALCLLRVSGPRARDALAKGFAIDLHPRAFATGDVAQTIVSHIAAGIRQISDAPAYEIWVARSLALSFWRWLEASAAEYGLEVTAAAASDA